MHISSSTFFCAGSHIHFILYIDFFLSRLCSEWKWGWSGGAKGSCILCHQSVQLILAYSWARPAILVKVEGECFYSFCFFPFNPVPLSSLFLSFVSSTTVSFLPFFGRRHKMTHKG